MRRLATTTLVFLIPTLALASQQLMDLEVLSPRFGEIDVEVVYSTADPVDETLMGVGFRIHYDSSALTFNTFVDPFMTGLLAVGMPELDLGNRDGIPATDRFVSIAWADRDGAWPGEGLTPLLLVTANFAINGGTGDPGPVGFTVISTATGALTPLFADGFESGDLAGWSGPFAATALTGVPPARANSEGLDILQQLMALAPPDPAAESVFPGAFLDVDGNGAIDPETDGILILRYLFGFTGDALLEGFEGAQASPPAAARPKYSRFTESLIANAVGPGATRTTAAEIVAYLDSIAGGLDVDGDGRRDALTDGILILRYMWGFRGDDLVRDAVSPGAVRMTANDIEDQLDGLVDPQGQGDSDGDGLDDATELAGYEILIDVLGLGTHDPRWQDTLERRFVTSDPFAPNSDDDSLTDSQEKLFRTDPRDEDTDDDGLTDSAELDRWASTPTSVDSDGDARGPDLDLTPNPLFFDGEELSRFGTSPALEDTDGDNRTDFTEANQNATPPLIAAVPRVAVELVGEIGIQLELTETTGTTSTTSESNLVAETDTTGVSNTDTTTNQWAIGASTTITVGAEVSFPKGASASTEVSTTISGEYSEETTASFTQDSSTSLQNEYQTIVEDSVTNEQTISGGIINTGIQIRNTGDVAFELADVVVSALLTDPDDRQAFTTIATLLPDLDGDGNPGGSVTLGPFSGETGVLQVEDDDVPARLATQLMADPSALYLDVASFSILDGEGRDFVFLSEVTNQRTALVTIDFGNGEVERYRVATLVERNPDGTGAGVTMADVLENILEIPPCTPGAEDCYETGARTMSMDPEFPNGVRLLTRVRNVETAVADEGVDCFDLDPATLDEELLNSFWAVLSDDPSLTGQTGVPFTTDFEDIVLQSEDTISLAFVTDSDRDGLFLREEFVHGTSDTVRDFDGDGDRDLADCLRASDFDEEGLPEFFEVRIGWEVVVDGLFARTVHSDPTRSDADTDGLLDDEEFRGADGCGPEDPQSPGEPDPQCGIGGAAPTDSGDATDPNLRDTDQDGLPDGLDPDPLDSFNVPPDLDAVACGGVTAAGADCVLVAGALAELTGTVTDPEDGVSQVRIEWGDGTEDTVCDGIPIVNPLPGETRTFEDLTLATGVNSCRLDPSGIPVDPSHQYATTGDFIITITAFDGRPAPFGPAQSQKTFDVSVVFPTDALALYYFTNESFDDSAGSSDGTLNDSGAVSTFTDDRRGSALDAFCTPITSGSQDEGAFVQLPPLPLGSELTLAAWVLPGDEPPGPGPPNAIIVGQSDYAWLEFTPSGEVKFVITDGVTTGEVTDPSMPVTQSLNNTLDCFLAVNEFDWTFYAATVQVLGSDTRLRLYRQEGGAAPSLGTHVAETVVSGVVFTNPSPTTPSQIGGPNTRDIDDIEFGFEGRVDDVRFYDRFLSAAELNALFLELPPP